MNAPAQLALFDETPKQARMPREIMGSANFGGPDIRWELRRWWRGGPTLCWIMCNPSRADGKRNDPTLWEVIFHTHRLGFGGLVVVNFYPFIASSPKACRDWADWNADGRGPDWYVRDQLHANLDVVARAAKGADQVMAAWGGIAWDDDWREHVLDEVQSGDAPWPALWCLGTTGTGAPKHPLARGHHRIPRDQQPILWRAA